MHTDLHYAVLSKDTPNPASSPVKQGLQVQIIARKKGSVGVKHSGVIGRHQFSPALEEVLVQMRQGQAWTLQDEGSKDRYSVEVLEVEEAETRSPFQQAEALKAQGNGQIKSKAHSQAILVYSQAYDLVLNDPSTQSQELKLSLVSNLALATLSSGCFSQALGWCEEHLQETVQPNLKVVYRKASAHKGLKQWEAAREDVKWGLELSQGQEESTGNFSQLLGVIEREQKEQQAKEKAVYGKMFG